MDYWKCIKSLDLHTSAGEYLGIAFTEGRFYQGEPYHATPGGEWAMQFTDNSQMPHLITSKALHEHFVKANKTERDEEEETPDGASLCVYRDYMIAREGADEPYEPDYWGAWYE